MLGLKDVAGLRLKDWTNKDYMELFSENNAHLKQN